MGELAGDRNSVWTPELAEPYKEPQSAATSSSPPLSPQERGMKYELILISHLITVLTSAMSYLLQECRGIWIISCKYYFIVPRHHTEVETFLQQRLGGNLTNPIMELSTDLWYHSWWQVSGQSAGDRARRMAAGTSRSSPALICLHLNSLCLCPHPLGIDTDSFRKPENCVGSDVSVVCQELN